MEGGATQAAAVATWALVCTQGDVLVRVAALRSRAARRFPMHSCLAELVGMLVGVTLLSALGTDGRVSMECVILLLSSVWVAGTLGGICTLGTCGMLGVCTLGTCSEWIPALSPTRRNFQTMTKTLVDKTRHRQNGVPDRHVGDKLSFQVN